MYAYICYILHRNHRPLGVNPFPESMLDKMSKHHNNILETNNFFGDSRYCSIVEEMVSVTETDDTRKAATPQAFTWQLAGYEATGVKETEFRVGLPLNRIQSQMDVGGNVKMTWDSTTIDMSPKIFDTTNQT